MTTDGDSEAIARRCENDHDEIVRLRADLAAFDRLTAERQAERDKALDTLEAVAREQRAAANEWRLTVTDVTGNKADHGEVDAVRSRIERAERDKLERTEYVTAHEILRRRVEALETFQARVLVAAPLALIATTIIGGIIGRSISL